MPPDLAQSLDSVDQTLMTDAHRQLTHVIVEEDDAATSSEHVEFDNPHARSSEPLYGDVKLSIEEGLVSDCDLEEDRSALQGSQVDGISSDYQAQ